MRIAMLLTSLLSLASSMAPVVASADEEIRYDRATVIEFIGRVDDIREVAAPAAIRGTHLVIQSENNGKMDTYLGPTSFVRDFLPYFAIGSVVQVVGSKVKSGTSVIVLARQVRKGEITLSLRDERGTPYWTT